MRTPSRILQDGVKTLRVSSFNYIPHFRTSPLQVSKMSTNTTKHAPAQSQSSSKPHLPVHVTRSTSASSILPATSTLVEAFESDPVTAYILHHLPTSARLAVLQKLFTLSSNATLMAGGELWSASTTFPSAHSTDEKPDFQAAASIFPPGKSLDDLGIAAVPSLVQSGELLPTLNAIGPIVLQSRMAAYTAATTPAKKSTFPNNETYYYVQLIGAATAHRGKGLAPALIRKLQERARDEGKPVYLEASNEGARRVYQKLGFEEVGDMIWLGKGVCDAQGERAEGEKAVGVPMWPMVWWPTGHGAAQK